MVESKQKKCAHPPCTCAAANDSKYCSAYCEGAAERPEIQCECGHASCAGAATAA